MFSNMKKTLFSLAIFAFFLSLYAEKANAQASGKKPELFMYRHNGSLGGSPSPVVLLDTLGKLEWRGLTAIGNIQTGATIKSVVTSPVSTGHMASNMLFSTNNGLNLRERMVITSTGLVGIGIVSPAEPQFHLDVVGNTHTSGNFWGRIHFDNNPLDDAPNTYFNEADRKSVV